MKCVLTLLVGVSVVFVAGCLSEPGKEEEAVVRDPAASDFSYGYWLNGWRKPEDDKTPDVLCFETGQYGFSLDVDDLANPSFGRIDDDAGYAEALAADSGRMSALSPAELAIELDVGGTTYRAVTCRAGEETAVNRLKTVRLWESGRFAQVFDVESLVFKDAAGTSLPCNGTLDLVAWPGSLSFNVSLAPDFLYDEGHIKGVVGNAWCLAGKPIDIPHAPALEPDHLTLECWFKMPAQMNPKARGWLICKNENEWGVGSYGLLYHHGTAHAVMNNLGGAHKQTSAGQHVALVPDQWYHLAMTFDGAALRFYLDGQKRGETALTTPRTKGTGLMRIGQRGDGRFGMVNGLYDQIRLWNRAFTAEELAAHAKAPAVLKSREGLVLEHGFDEGPVVEAPVWTDAELRVGFKGAGETWETKKRVAGTWTPGDRHALTLNCNMDDRHAADRAVAIDVSTADGQAFPVRFDPAYNCHVAEVKGLKRDFAGGYVKIAEYDEFLISIDSQEAAAGTVPFLFDLYGPANITGLVPILCYPDGTPTGIPVQLSKNWHYVPLGAYLRAYTMLPSEPGKNEYLLRIAYSLYGSLPTASHAQLSLVGWGANGRWDQLSVGAAGETICFDMDMSPTDQVVTDVRGMMLRKGLEGATWGWTDAGWGGDWFNVRPKGDRLAFAGMKTAYLAHGPCLSDVRYEGYYGSGRDVFVRAGVRTMRTDDYVRTFQKLRYEFKKSLPAGEAYLFKMDGQSAIVPKIAYGNRGGVIAERDTPSKEQSEFIECAELSGEGPWWVAFPGSKPTTSDRDWGTASRGLIVRSYRASFGGHIIENPSITVPGDYRKHRDLTYDLWLVPPADVESLKPGDWVEMDVEWITVPRIADDYYGPNESFRQHLSENPESWKTVHREAVGNDLKVEVSGGKLLQSFPIVIRAEKPEVTVKIHGGLGYVPIRFEGLKTADGYQVFEKQDNWLTPLRQSSHGNDFWQTDYDAASSSYKMTFNLPLDGKRESQWILKR
jgi:hypothetical protein